MARNLKEYPAWQYSDLGIPLPDDQHATSVCLPTWDSVIGYEEACSSVTDQMKCGYPRFFRHPFINRLFTKAEADFCNAQQSAIVFPHLPAAKRAKSFVEKRGAHSVTISPIGNLYALIVDNSFFKVALEYWRYTGEIVSSRQAEHLLESPSCSVAQTDLLIPALAKSFGCSNSSLFLYENGMSAAFASFRAALSLNPDKKTLQLEFPYVDVLKIQQNFGVGVEYLNLAEGPKFEEILKRIKQSEFSAVFCELPSNPLLRSVDVKALSHACRKGHVPLIIDDTICSHYNVDVSSYADLITTSLTKWISGKGDVMGGAIRIGNTSPLKAQLHHFFQQDNPTGSRIFSSDEDTLLSNLNGFESRMQRANTNGETISAYLEAHPSVELVWYPSLTKKEQYDAVKTAQGGYGGLISFCLKNAEDAPAVFDNLKLSKGPSLGTEFTLACPYTLLAHYDELDWTTECGVPTHLIRISLGVEQTDILIETIATAIDSVNA